MSKLLKKFAYADMGVILSVTSLCIISLVSLYQLSQNGISASLTSGYSRRAGIIQAASVLAGLFGGGFCILAGSGFIRKACLPVFFITIILSVLTLTPLGVTVADDRAWLRLGTFSIQPSELMKAAMIPALAFSLTLQRSRVLRYLLFACFSLCACTVVYLQRDIGSLLIVLLLQRLMKTDTSQGEFASFIRVGAFALFAGEAILNIGMNLSVLPVIGIPLPFVSAGGTAMAAGLTLIGAALSAPGKGKAR